MKKTLFAVSLLLAPMTLLAEEDKWYLGAGWGNYNMFGTENNQDIADTMFNLYMTHSSNLQLSYRLGLRDRYIYKNQSGLETSSQTLLAADIIYNVLHTQSGWFVDLEAGLVAPLTTTEFTQGVNIIEGQQDPGAHFGFGFGYIVNRSFTIRAHMYIDASVSQFTNGIDTSNSNQQAQGLELIYSW